MFCARRVLLRFCAVFLFVQHVDATPGTPTVSIPTSTATATPTSAAGSGTSSTLLGCPTVTSAVTAQTNQTLTFSVAQQNATLVRFRLQNTYDSSGLYECRSGTPTLCPNVDPTCTPSTFSVGFYVPFTQSANISVVANIDLADGTSARCYFVMPVTSAVTLPPSPAALVGQASAALAGLSGDAAVKVIKDYASMLSDMAPGAANNTAPFAAAASLIQLLSNAVAQNTSTQCNFCSF